MLILFGLGSLSAGCEYLPSLESISDFNGYWDAEGVFFGASNTYPTDLVFQLKQVSVESGAITDLGIEGSEPTLSRRGDLLAFAHRREDIQIFSRTRRLPASASADHCESKMPIRPM